MKFRFVAPFVGIALLAGCASDSAPGPGRGAPIIPSVAATKSFDDVDQAFMTEHFAKAMALARTEPERRLMARRLAALSAEPR